MQKRVDGGTETQVQAPFMLTTYRRFLKGTSAEGIWSILSWTSVGWPMKFQNTLFQQNITALSGHCIALKPQWLCWLLHAAGSSATIQAALCQGPGAEVASLISR